MFPAPTTIAISTPRSWSSRISPAIRSTSFRSRPYSFSPISASPESFSRTRRKAALPSCSCKSLPVVLDDLQLMLLERLRDGLAGVVDPLLVGKDHLAEEPLREHPLNDLLSVFLRPRLHLREPRDLGRAPGANEDADLARRRVNVRGERLVLALLLEPRLPADRDVLAELADELLPLVLQLVDC